MRPCAVHLRRPTPRSVSQQFLRCNSLWVLTQTLFSETTVKSGYRPLRTIHLLFVPDEEIGGADGMGVFLKSDLYAGLNVGVVLDEGLANPENAYTVFYGERQVLSLV